MPDLEDFVHDGDENELAEERHQNENVARQTDEEHKALPDREPNQHNHLVLSMTIVYEVALSYY